MTLIYGLYFADPVAGAAAIAANGGLILSMTPDVALATYPLGVIVQVSPGIPFTSVPGTMDLYLGTPFVPGLGRTGVTYAPNVIATTTLSTSVTAKVYQDLTLLSTTTSNFVWQGTIITAGVFTPSGFTGSLQVQVVRYTGDGTNNRFVATPFSLLTGTVAIWICGGAGAISDVNIFRHNNPAMLGTSIMALGLDPVTTSGIMSFGATGFTVTPGTSFGNGYANTTGHKYVAIVVSDTTSDNRYLKVGRYTGDGTDPRNITTVGVQAVTHAWVWGRGVAYSSTDFGANQSVSLSSEAYAVTGVIEAVGTSTIQVGSANNVNNNLTNYDYMALCADVGFLNSHLFVSFKGTGGAVPPTVVSALGLTPEALFARWYTTLSAGAYWRGLDHTGTDSNVCATTSGFNDDPSTAIVAMSAGTASFGVDIAPNAGVFYGWAWASGTLTPAPTYAPAYVDVLGDAAMPVTATMTAVEGAGFPINVPNSWALQQCDVKPRDEETQ